MVTSSNAGNLAIIVNDSLYPFIRDTMQSLYLADLQTDGYSPLVLTWSSDGTARDLRNLLGNLYYTTGIEGAVFVGALPYAECLTDYGVLKTDLYFMDLDGFWLDPDSNGIFDSHIGDVGPEIWVGRLDCRRLTYNDADEVFLLQQYFSRNHLYRVGALNLPDSALLYPDFQLEPTYQQGLYLPLKEAYWNLEAVFNAEFTNGDDYATRLAQDYEFICLVAHSTATVHHFDGSTYFYSYQIPEIHPKTSFYWLSCCSAADFSYADYLAGWYVFDDSAKGLWAVGLADDGGLPIYREPFNLLSSYNTIGEAVIELVREATLCFTAYYPIVLIGDPTLRLRREMARVEVLFYDQAGDFDLTPDPGETLQVYVKLRNQAENQTIQGITAALSAEDARITILDSTASYGDFGPGQEKINSTPFRIAISPTAPRGLRIPIDLRISSSDGREWLTGFYLNIEKPFITYFWQRWDDPDGNLDPGETSPLYVQLHYDTLWASWGGLDTGQAHICATGVTAILRSLDTALIITDSVASYGIISWGMKAWPIDPFRVRASSGIAQAPYVALLELEVRTNESSPKLDTFSVTVGDYEFFYDDFESGAKAWLHEPLTPGWSDEWHLEDYRHNSGQWSWKCGGAGNEGYSEFLDASLETPPIRIGDDFVMSFWYFVDVESFWDTAYSCVGVLAGGIIEANWGEGWKIVSPVEGYLSKLIGCYPQFINLMPCYGQKDFGWENSVFDLSDWTNSFMEFRFRFLSESDASPFFEGLYIDDFYVGPATGITERAERPGLSLSVSPNPARGQLKISFTLPDEGPYSLRLYDAAGRMVRVIDDGPGRKDPGLPGEIFWMPDVPRGIYFLRLEAGVRALTEKLVLN